MGCFDSVFAQCPSCGSEVEFQSKAGDCALDRFTLENVPEDVLGDLLSRKKAGDCKACGVALVLAIAVFVAPPEASTDA